jgi:NADH:ubiquinone oxidoreductase subunit 6 (subunit J)
VLHIGLIVCCIFCAVQAVRATRLLTAALWLAGVSASLATFLYAVGAHEVAVIELSVGTGLVTVLFVFAISLTGQAPTDAQARLPRPLAWALVMFSSLLLGWMTLPWLGIPGAAAEETFARALWHERGLDVLIQIVLMFIGALGVVGLLAGIRGAQQHPPGGLAASGLPETIDEQPGTAELSLRSSVPAPRSEQAPEEVEA